LEAHAVHVARAHMEHAAALRGAAEGLRHLGLRAPPACSPPPPAVQATPTEPPVDGAKSLMERSLAGGPGLRMRTCGSRGSWKSSTSPAGEWCGPPAFGRPVV
jgi:hypothetical protein